jgi:hypothetical protein
MKFDIATVVWGQWHCHALRSVMLPTLLAPQNLPAMAQRGEVRYRIFTTAHDKPRLEALPILRRLAAAIAVEIIAGSDDVNPDPVHHLRWYHRAVTEARESKAIVVFAPPDVLWSDGTFTNLAAVMAHGSAACAAPYLRVVSETCVPEVEERQRRDPAQALAIAPGDLVALALRHLHPLTAAIFARSPHSRPTLEMIWPVPCEGLLLRHAVRELFALDPTRVTASDYFYAATVADPRDLHIVTDSDDMLMLSLAPLMKDIGDIGIYIPHHRPEPIDVARSSLHPLNDTPFNDMFIRQAVRLHTGAMTEARWRSTEARAEAAFHQVLVLRQAMQIWKALHAEGCHYAARLLAAAIETTPLASRWRRRGPLAIFAPRDIAFAFTGPSLPAMLAPGAEHHLLHFIENHVKPRSAGIIERPTARIGEHRLYVVDELRGAWSLPVGARTPALTLA